METTMNTCNMSREALIGIGMKPENIGKNVQVSTMARIINPAGLVLGDHSRIDDFALLICTGEGIKLGRNVRISAFCYLNGYGGIEVGDFTGMAARCTLYSVTSDISGDYICNPTVGEKYERFRTDPIILEKHVCLGTGTIILPGCLIEEGACTGANTKVTSRLGAWRIWDGAPPKYVRLRSQNAKMLEEAYLHDLTLMSQE